MKAIRVISEGDGARLELHDEPLPSPGRREVLIRIHAASLNFRDVALLKGQYPANTKKNVIPLSDGAGEVVAVGREGTRVKVGDRVAISCTEDWISGPYVPEYRSSSVGFIIDGVLAEYAVFHENALVHLPDYMTYTEAASLPCAAVTAWTSLNFITPLLPGQSVLIQGTGGVSMFALQIAKVFGARVLAITSSDEKAEKLKEMGAEAVVNYSTHPDWDREILALTDGRGVDKVLDIAGEKTIVKSAASTKITGEIALIGFASGIGGGLGAIDILSRSLTIRGSTIGPRTDFEALLKVMEIHQLRPVIDRIYPFADYLEAYKRIESGKHVGKVVIDLTK
ncbi:hypothetical protein jhhlp_005440 [Lomentospora prolificans]|uniref:Enoyl reductase (ER) domain-containing protein n=1 Tax=Lomentospora prolificans TaxID=41688 RepID=A0A2N3N6Y2_9PEZI|nr:hypothetical protein jhhlp_005440 [Lomentospora prolificans]